MTLVRLQEALGIALDTYACYTATGCVVERFEDIYLVNQSGGPAFELEVKAIEPLSFVGGSGHLGRRKRLNKEDIWMFTRRS